MFFTQVATSLPPTLAVTMAGFLPDALPPVSLSRTPTATTHDRSNRPTTSLGSPFSTSSPTSILTRSQHKPSGSWSFRTPSLNHSDPLYATSRSVHTQQRLPRPGGRTYSPEISFPTNKLARTESSHSKTNPRHLNGGCPIRDNLTKDKRKKLVKRSLQQPTFEMVTPGQVAAEAQAAQLDAQLAELIAEIERESTCGETDEVTKENTAPGKGKGNEPAPPRTSYLKPVSRDEKQRSAKRWSHAPLLPELDFGSSGSESSVLFDPETHTPPPSATVYISAMASMNNMGLMDMQCTSTDPGKLTYRCDVHAENGASHRSVEQACQEVVTNAGGCILNSYFYPGGFLYSLPPDILEPLTTCEIPTHEAKIEVHGWMAFSEPRFNGLRMHPPEGQLGGEKPRAASKFKEGLDVRRDNGLDLVDAWVKSDGVAVVVDLPDEKIQEKTADKTEENSKNDNQGSDKTHKAPDVEAPIKTPSRKPAIMKSLETLRRRATGGSRSFSNSSPPPLPPMPMQSPATSHERRYTVVLESSVSHSGNGSASGSAAEEWESVQSGPDTQGRSSTVEAA